MCCVCTCVYVRVRVCKCSVWVWVRVYKWHVVIRDGLRSTVRRTHLCLHARVVQALDHCLHVFMAARQAHSSTLNILANALHRVFTVPSGCGDSTTRERLRSACFDYLSIGGARRAGPVGLLSA